MKFNVETQGIGLYSKAKYIFPYSYVLQLFLALVLVVQQIRGQDQNETLPLFPSNR